MKKIGVSSCFFYPDPSRLVFGPKQLNYLEADMARYLARSNAMPILIPDLEDPEFSQFLDQCDGFVLQGGSDLSPKSYGEEGIENNRWSGDPYRDQYEFRICKYAFEKKKPLFGICRGHQVINVFFGGTLFQDIESQNASSKPHRCASQYDSLGHGVRVESGGWLEGVYPVDQVLAVNSVHHQAIKDLGKDLRTEAASADDGIIEAISYSLDDHPFILGVQWHPEFFHTQGDKLIDPHPLYDLFLDQL